jgi:hypothetical protein
MKIVCEDFKWKQVTGDTMLSLSSRHVCFVLKKSQLQGSKKINYTGFHSFPLLREFQEQLTWSTFCSVDYVLQIMKWSGGGGCWTVIGRNDGLILSTHRMKTTGTLSSEWVYCANAFRIGSSNSSIATESCLCASGTFQANIISRSVDSNHPISYFCSEVIISVVESSRFDNFRDIIPINSHNFPSKGLIKF